MHGTGRASERAGAMPPGRRPGTTGKATRDISSSYLQPTTTSFHLSSWWLLDRRNPQGFASKHLRQHDARPLGGGSMDSWKHGSSPFPARTILEHPPDQLCARGFPPCPARTPAPQATNAAGTAQLERHKRPRVCLVLCLPLRRTTTPRSKRSNGAAAWPHGSLPGSNPKLKTCPLLGGW